MFELRTLVMMALTGAPLLAQAPTVLFACEADCVIDVVADIGVEKDLHPTAHTTPKLSTTISRPASADTKHASITA